MAPGFLGQFKRRQIFRQTFSIGGRFASLGQFLLLDGFPVRILGLRVNRGKELGVTSAKFFLDTPGDIPKVEASLFGVNLREKNNLKEQISQFRPDVMFFAVTDGIHQFIGFFQNIRPQALRGLSTIPCAAMVRAQKAHGLYQLLERAEDAV